MSKQYHETNTQDYDGKWQIVESKPLVRNIFHHLLEPLSWQDMLSVFKNIRFNLRQKAQYNWSRDIMQMFEEKRNADTVSVNPAKDINNFNQALESHFD